MSLWINFLKIKTIIEEDDVCVILRDKRGSHRHLQFYDSCLELEIEAKAYAIERLQRKI